MPAELVDLAGDGWLEKTQEVVSKWYNEPYNAENYQAVFDQFDIYLGAVKEAGKLYSGFNPGYCFGGWYYDVGLTEHLKIQNYVGVKNFDDTFTVVDAIQSDEFRVFAKNIAEYYKKGYIRSDVSSWDSSTVSFVKNGEYNANTLILDCNASLTESAMNSFEADAGVDVDFINVEKRGYLGSGNTTSMVIPYCADEPERAMMVLNALYTNADLYQLLIWGIEGKHYTKNADGTITTAYGATPKADSDYGLEKWRIGTCANALATESENPNYYSELVELEKQAYVSPFKLKGSFSLKTDEVKDIIAALKAVDDEYYPMIQRGYTGDNWEKTLDKWIAERKAAGVDKLVEVYQKQLDEHRQAKGITSWDW